MSGRIVIRVEEIWKQYRLGIVSHATLQQDLQSWWARLRGQEDPNLRINTSDSDASRYGERFWALKDVSFDVSEGDVLGIIGSNGAGKSTLLKILSRVTTPTRGQIKVRGRIASLLEVGTGFHPELTGRENILLNGAILGMGKPEIRQKLDEIIAFSEVEKFIDTPVKRYSSGMYVRLAFAVAAHLEPEILVVDEVLAVGDAQFQKKCLGKMQEVSREGRTVLFVSHNMRAVRSLCKSAILLENGGITIHSSVDKAVETYLKVNNCGLLKDAIKRKISNLPEDQDFKLLDICMYQNNSEVETYVCNGSPLELQISFLVKRDVRDLLIFIRLCDQEENFIFHSVSGGCNESLADFSHGEYKARLTIPDNYLAPRNYLLQIGASIYKKRRCLPEWLGVNLNVVQTGCVDRACPDIAPGLLLPQLPWEVVRL